MDFELLFKDIVNILKNEGKTIVRLECMKQLLSLTGLEESINLLLNQHDLIKVLISLMVGQQYISKISCQSLINLSTNEIHTQKLLNLHESSSQEHVTDKAEIIMNCVQNILDNECELADTCCMLLCNISRTCLLVNYVVDHIPDFESTINKLVDAFCDLSYNKKGCKLDYLAPFFLNLSQSPTALNHLCKLIERLVSFTDYKESKIRRAGIIGLLRNLSFRSDKHGWLLSDDGLNILPVLLMPLAGPEEFPDDEMDKLPLQIQYLPDTKERESDPEIKIMLLETLLQLCSQTDGRKTLRDQNAYIILRELHKNEKDRKVLLACENVIDILIRTEEEIGVDVLSTIQVPDDLKTKFEKMDNDFLSDS